MANIRTCFRCGAALTIRTPLDVCPRCVAAHALAPDGSPDSESAGRGPDHSSTLSEQVGDRIGRYKLLEKIGEGGCGIVYVAEQSEPVRRRVALKVIKLGMDTRAVVARFEAERQALAMMDHPHIAKVFDGGSTPTGRPYFVMELVRGARLTDYCDDNRLPMAARLELFIQVCHAVQHAHQKGIIHRDLKPSNILVTINDGKPVPKVIDFGVAKAAAGQTLTDKTVYTAFEQFIGTPAYMSPEQTLLTSLDIDTRSDIYSLGVLLYELLTGRLPFDPRRLLEAGIDEIRRTIREVEPPRPSARLSTLGAGELTTAARRRSTEVDRLVQEVRGDLDWIVIKCLEKDRNRRYETATNLAADLQRHLHHETVTARPPSAIYALRKLMRRNRAAVAAAGSVAVAVLAGLGLATTLFLKERRTSRRASQAEQAATTQAAQATHAAEESRQRLLRLQLSNGTRLMEEGDLMRALPWFVEAFKSDRSHPENEAAHRLRLATILQQCPRPKLMSFHAGTAGLAVSPDKTLMVTGTRDGTSALWEMASGRLIAMDHGPRHVSGTLKCGFSADSRMALFYSDEGETALVWKLGVGTARAQRIETGERLRSALLSPDGRYLVSSGDKKLLAVWDTTTGRPLRGLAGVAKKVDTTAFISGSNARAVFGADTGTSNQVLLAVDRAGFVGVWEVDSGRLLAERRIQPTIGEAIRHRGKFSSDGRLLLQPEGQIGDLAFGARLWNVAEGKRIATLKHEHHIHDVVFSPDNAVVVTSCQDHAVRIWDTRTGALRGAPLQHPEAVEDLALSPSGHLLAAATTEDRTVRIWNIDTGQLAGPPLLHGHDVRKIDFSVDDATVVTACRDGSVRVWDLAVGPSWVWAGALDSAEDVFFLNTPLDAAYSQDWGAVLKHPQGVSFLGIHQSQPRVVVQPEGTKLRDAAASWDGERLLLRRREDGKAQIQLWSTADSQPLGPAFSPDDPFEWGPVSADAGTLLAQTHAPAELSVQVWNTQTGQPAGPRIDLPPTSRTVEGKFDQNLLCPAGDTIIASRGNRVHVWTATNGQPKFAPIAQPYNADYLSISRDGRHLAVGWKGLTEAERFAQAYDLQTGLPIGPRFAEGSGPEFVSFDHSGRRVVAGAAHHARVWDVVTGQPVSPVFESAVSFNSAAFSPDDRWVLGASDNGVARIWDASTATPMMAPLPHGYEIHVGIIKQTALLMLNQRVLHTFSAEPRCWELPVDARPFEQWEQIAQLLSARRLDHNGNLSPLDINTQSNLWAALHTQSTAEFSASARRRYDWNIWQAELCMARFNPAGALPHLRELVAAEPARIRFRSVRARAHEALQQWPDATDDLRVATRLSPHNIFLWLRLAGAELASGDVAAYQRTCEAIADHRPGDESRDAMKIALKLATYTTNSPALLKRLSAQLDSIPRSAAWTERGFLEFRLGRYEQAIALLQRDSNVRSLLFRAMAHFILGQRNEAQAALANARGRRIQASYDMIMGNNVPAFGPLNELLFHEAEAMIR